MAENIAGKEGLAADAQTGKSGQAMITDQAYRRRVEHIRARINSPYPHVEDLRRDVLWLLAELERA